MRKLIVLIGILLAATGAHVLGGFSTVEDERAMGIWNVETGALVNTMQHYPVSWSPDGALLAMGLWRSREVDPDVVIVGLNGRAVSTLAEIQGEVKSISWSPDGAAGNGDGRRGHV